MQEDLNPKAALPPAAELEKLAAQLRDLRDSLILASVVLKDHLADLESDQMQSARELGQQAIAKARESAPGKP